MIISADIPADLAIKNGYDEFGRQCLEICVSQLTVEERDILAKHLDTRNNQPLLVGYTQPALDTTHFQKQLDAWIAQERERDSIQQKMKQEAYDQAVSVLLERKTRTSRMRVVVTLNENYTPGCDLDTILADDNFEVRAYFSGTLSLYGEGEYTQEQPAWAYNTNDADVRKLPEAIAWEASLEDRNAQAKEKAIVEAKGMLIGKVMLLHTEYLAKREWIETHGSKHLQRMFAEGINCLATYRNERLAHERPGWRWQSDVPGEYLDIEEVRNPPEWAMDLLDKARETEPTAMLHYVTIKSDDEEEDKYTTYAATADYLDRSILMFDTKYLSEIIELFGK